MNIFSPIKPECKLFGGSGKGWEECFYRKHNFTIVIHIKICSLLKFVIGPVIEVGDFVIRLGTKSIHQSLEL